MKYKSLINNCLAIVLLVVSAISVQAEETRSMDDDLAYYYGFTIGNMLKAEGFTTVDSVNYKAGIADAFSGSEPALTKEQQKAVVEMVKERREVLRNEQLVLLQTQGTAFLAENAARDGVQQTASGLQYEVLVEGTGPQPSVASTVLAHYKGALMNGQEFDNSIARGEPA
jgi:FKBP-type peptidyl-prolyl cis-trans isomerase FklB